jgi:hypothetical protein
LDRSLFCDHAVAGCVLAVGSWTEAHVPLKYDVTILRADTRGRVYWRSTLGINDALLTLLRFARQHPNSQCRIELRDSRSESDIISVEPTDTPRSIHVETPGQAHDTAPHEAEAGVSSQHNASKPAPSSLSS